jgi:hypothetical protein
MTGPPVPSMQIKVLKRKAAALSELARRAEFVIGTGSIPMLLRKFDKLDSLTSPAFCKYSTRTVNKCDLYECMLSLQGAYTVVATG